MRGTLLYLVSQEWTGKPSSCPQSQPQDSRWPRFSVAMCVSPGEVHSHAHTLLLSLLRYPGGTSGPTSTISWTCFTDIMGLGGEAEHVHLGTSQKPGPGRSFRSTLSGLVLDTRTQDEDDMPSSCAGRWAKSLRTAVCTQPGHSRHWRRWEQGDAMAAGSRRGLGC